MSFEAETLCLQRDRAPTTEWVDNRWQSLGIAAPNFCPCFFKDLLVVCSFPGDKSFDDVKQTPTLSFLVRLGRKRLGVCRRVVNELCEQDGATCSERPTRPPEVKCAGMPVPDALFPRSLAIDDIKWQSNLNQLGRHHAPNGEAARCQ